MPRQTPDDQYSLNPLDSSYNFSLGIEPSEVFLDVPAWPDIIHTPDTESIREAGRSLTKALGERKTRPHTEAMKIIAKQPKLKQPIIQSSPSVSPSPSVTPPPKTSQRSQSIPKVNVSQRTSQQPKVTYTESYDRPSLSNLPDEVKRSLTRSLKPEDIGEF